MLTLSFDTTASACSVLLKKNDQLVAKYIEPMEFGQAEALIVKIDELLKQNSLLFSDIGAVFVCVGPGSFTGVRSSVSAARTFQLACPNLLLGGVSAFDAWVLELKEEEISDVNAVIIETKREDFYIQLFDANLNKQSSPQALNYDEIIEMLKNKHISLIGDGVERFLSRPSGLSLHSIKFGDFLNIENVWQAGMRQYEKKRFDYPKPLYLRAPDVTVPKR